MYSRMKFNMGASRCMCLNLPVFASRMAIEGLMSLDLNFSMSERRSPVEVPKMNRTPIDLFTPPNALNICSCLLSS